MKKLLFLSLLIAIFVVTPFFAFSQEIIYPSIPGVAAPQEFLKEVQSQEEILPLFMTYFFHLFLVVSIAVAVSIMLYGGFIYIISSGDPEKRKHGKSWMLSALQGSLIVFASYSLLFTLDSQLVLFQQREIDKTGTEGKVDLKWEIKNVYYQIPFGLLIEDAILNETAQSKLYDVLNATYKAEDTSNAIEQGSKQLLEIIEKCPDKEPCCGEGGDINSPPINKKVTPKEEKKAPLWVLEINKLFEKTGITDWEKPENEVILTSEKIDKSLFSEDYVQINQPNLFKIAGVVPPLVDGNGKPIGSITFSFGEEYTGGLHRGTDISAPLGSTIQSTTEGFVIYAGDMGGTAGGAVSILYHDEKTDTHFIIHYVHLDINSITPTAGKKISQGQKIGEIGTSGRVFISDKDKGLLHYEVILLDKDTDIGPIIRGECLYTCGKAIDPVKNGFLKINTDKTSYQNIFFASLFTAFNPTTSLLTLSFVILILLAFLFLSIKVTALQKKVPFTRIRKRSFTSIVSIVLVLSLALSSLPISYLQKSPSLVLKESIKMQNQTELSFSHLNFNIVFAENNEGNSYWQHVWKETKEGAVLGGATGATVGGLALGYLGAVFGAGGGGVLGFGVGAIPGAILGGALGTAVGGAGGAILGGVAGGLVRGGWALFTYEEAEEKCPDNSSPQIDPCGEGQTEVEQITDPDTGKTIYCCEEEEEEEDTFTENCEFYEDECPDGCNLGNDSTDCGGNTPSPSHLCCCCEEEEEEKCGKEGEECDNENLCCEELKCEDGKCIEKEEGECSDGLEKESETTCNQKQLERGCEPETVNGKDICCCKEEIDCSQLFGEDYSLTDEPSCSEGQAKHGCEEIQDEEGNAIGCCCPEEPFCLEDGCDVAEKCPEGTLKTDELDGMLCCCEEEEEEEEECPKCPDIASAVQAKIGEIEGHMTQLAKDLEALLLTKEPIKEDLYQLYKVVMLKSLGYKQVFGYNSLLLEKRYYERGEVVIDTDREVSQIGKYTWDWSRWINNILYRIELGGRVIEENDSATFYLRMPESKKIVEDALRLAKEAKANDIQKIGKDISVKKPQSQNIFQKVFSLVTGIFSDLGSKETLAQTDMKKLQDYLDEHKIDPAKISATEFNEIVKKLGISTDQGQTLSVLQRMSPSEFLECNMEIPIGEAFELTWAHLIELLDTIDKYVEEGKKLIEQQAKMNELARPCDCPCEGDEKCPNTCGACKLTCDLNAIKAAHQEVLKTREKMKEIAAHIVLLTDGHFNTPTENLCDSLNEDVRDDAEKVLCAGGGKKLISKHELITRKLNYSRFSFDECITRPEHLEDVLGGKRAGKLPFFGPLVEEKGIPRYTKTIVSGSRVNTSDFNWFCCSDSKLEDK